MPFTMKKPSSILLHPVAEAGAKESGRASSRKRSAPPENGNGAGEHISGNRERILECDALNMNTILVALAALKKGDFGVRLPVTFTNTEGKVADAFNDVAELLLGTTQDLSRISHVVGKEGKINERLNISGATGCVGRAREFGQHAHHLSRDADQRNRARDRRRGQRRSFAKHGAGNEGRPLEGEFLRTAKTVNTMVDQLGAFASEVTRVAREVGTEGKLGGQAKVKGVAGTWKDLTDNVNLMAVEPDLPGA